MKKKPFVCRAVVYTFAIFSTVLAYGQTNTALPLAPLDAGLRVTAQDSSCGAVSLLSDARLTLKQRSCLYGKQLISPKFALAAGFGAAFEQFRNSPHVPRQQWQHEYPHRLEVYYSRRAARNSAEFLAGYLHHEDPRSRASTERGFWRRTDAAFLSVLTSPDEDGRLRPALAPIAGSFGSAFAGASMYRNTQTLSQTLSFAALVYGHYFVHALLTEFKPELNSYVRRVLHRAQ